MSLADRLWRLLRPSSADGVASPEAEEGREKVPPATEGDEIWLYGASVASVSYSDVAGGLLQPTS